MRLLYLSTPWYADCDFPLIRTFQEKGIDVTYLILLPPFALRSTLIDIREQYPKTGIFPATIYPELKIYENYMDMSQVYVANRTCKSRLTISYWLDSYYVRKFIRRGSFDVVHADTLFGGNKKDYYRLAPFVTTFHDPFPHTGEGRKNHLECCRMVAELSKGVVLLNGRQKEEFCSMTGLVTSKVLVNSLGVYDNIRAFIKSDITPRHNNILFFGRMSPYKGVEYLCRAMVQVREQVPDATLTIAGGGKMYFDFTPYEELDYIELYNHYVPMNELAELLSRCELSVCPYTDATQSGVIMTSFSLRKPVVATNVGGLGEMIDDGKSGLLVPSKDEKALADAIIALLKNRERLTAMSEYIHQEYYEGDRSWDAIADKYIEFYEEIIRRNNK